MASRLQVAGAAWLQGQHQEEQPSEQQPQQLQPAMVKQYVACAAQGEDREGGSAGAEPQPPHTDYPVVELGRNDSEEEQLCHRQLERQE